MRKLALVFVFVGIGVAQVEPPSWFQFFGWLESLGSGDVAKHEKFLNQRASRYAQLRHPFILEAAAEMKLREQLGGLSLYRIVILSETEMRATLKGKDGLSWVDAAVWVDDKIPYPIIAIELHQIPAPPLEPPSSMYSTETEPLPSRNLASTARLRLSAPGPWSPSEGSVFDHFPRHTKLQWRSVSGAAGYRVQWDYKDGDAWASEIRDPSALFFDTLETRYTFDFLGAQAGRWRVCAFDEMGIPGVWSEWRHFRYTR